MVRVRRPAGARARGLGVAFLVLQQCAEHARALAPAAFALPAAGCLACAQRLAPPPPQSRTVCYLAWALEAVPDSIHGNYHLKEVSALAAWLISDCRLST